MTDKGGQQGEYQNIPAQAGNGFKAVHNRGIYYGSCWAMRCLFFSGFSVGMPVVWFCIPQSGKTACTAWKTKKDCQDFAAGGSASQAGSCQIAQKKRGTGIVCESEQIFRLPPADLSGGIQIPQRAWLPWGSRRACQGQKHRRPRGRAPGIFPEKKIKGSKVFPGFLNEEGFR